MAAVEVPTTAATMPAPASPPKPPHKTAAPSPNDRRRNKKSDGLKGVKRSRLRIDGKRVESKDEIKNWILQMINEGPKTPATLAKLTNYSKVQIWKYCTALQAEGKIEKEGQAWKKAGISTAARELASLKELSEQEIYQLPVMQNLLKAVQRKPRRRKQMTHCVSIFMGGVVPTFKINPEAWQHPQTLDAFKQAYMEHTGKKKMPSHLRATIRFFYSFGRKQPLSKSEAEEYGVTGKKDSIGAYSHVKLTDEEIQKALAIVSKNGNLAELTESELRFAALFAAGIETFARPERLLCAPVANWETRYDKNSKEFLTTRIHEAKTDKTWRKYVKNPLAVAIVKAWIAVRRKGGYRHLFHDGNEDTRESQLGRVLNQYEYEHHQFDQLRGLYRQLGKTEEKDPYFFKKAMYALRHTGAHLWLRRTHYNYGAVAAMGWEDISTLRTWYGDMDEGVLDDLITNPGAIAAFA